MQACNHGPEGEGLDPRAITHSLDPRGITVQQTKLEKHNRVCEKDNTNKGITQS